MRDEAIEGRAPLLQTRCPCCGEPNRCAPAAAGRFDVACWCTAVQADPARLAALPDAVRGRACLCERCLCERCLCTPPAAPPAA